ncbi:MAG: DUF126 domain-containing protein [Longimicrobiales bacterium]|nr:DUF126 domain-containing protein [Longimicrobiales bacterium]
MVTGSETVTGRPLVAADGEGPLLRLTHPISLWGGVDPRSGRIVDPRHPQHGASLAGKVVVLPAAVGSSSSSAIMLELLREGTAPAGIVMGRADAILALGMVVGRELGYAPVPVVEAPPEAFRDWEEGASVRISQDGVVEQVSGA